MARKKKETPATIEQIALNYKNGVYGTGVEAKQNIRRLGYNLKQIERLSVTVNFSLSNKRKKSSKLENK